MTLFNKEKMMNGFEKVVDAANSAADKAEQFAKDKELDKKADAVKDKVDRFVKENELDKKAADAKEKTKQFVKEKELDKKFDEVRHSVGEGLRKAGDGIEKGCENRKYHKLK